MEDLFSFPDNKRKVTEESNGRSLSAKAAFKAKVKTENRNAAFAEIIKSAGGMPQPDQIVAIKTNGLSDTGSIFHYLAENNSLKELYLATWIISRQNIEVLTKALDEGRLKKAYFVVSTRLKELKKANYSFLVEEFQKRSDKIKFKVCNSHAKTFSVSDTEGNYFTVTGSGNWTENPRIENYLILNNKDLFNHNKDWMTELID